MEPLPNIESTETNNPKKKKIIFAIVILLCLGTFAYLFWQKAASLPFFRTSQKTEQNVPEHSAQGTLILSLQSLDAEKNSGIFAYDIPNEKLKEIYTKKGRDSFCKGGVVNPDGNTLAFIEEGKDRNSTINLLDLKTKEKKEIVKLENTLLDGLNWSPDGSSLVYASNWGGVFVIDLEGKQKFTAAGTDPKFISNESIVVSGEGKFWEVDFKNKNEKLIYDGTAISNDMRKNMRYDVSNDLSMIALTIPAQKIFNLADLEKTGDKFILKNTKAKNALVYSPQISPDGKYIVAEKPGALILADTQNLNAVSILDIKPFLISDNMITDWVPALSY